MEFDKILCYSVNRIEISSLLDQSIELDEKRSNCGIFKNNQEIQNA